MPYIGEIRMFAGNFAPVGWALCQGQTLAISENDTLFNLIGTTYGGDGQTTFNLPDLSSRLPVHMGTSPQGGTFLLGQSGGAEQVTLSTQQIPSHSHPLQAAHVTGDQITPSGNLPANSFNVTPYINDVPSASMNAGAITSVGGSQPHDNMQPFLCINFIISLFGVFPSPS
jgi:microcystin-dependent protein